jgi:nucleoside-diphosphate-sugar epimerase
MDKILITGAGGFIGQSLANYLKKKKQNVYLTLNNKSKPINIDFDKKKIFNIDLTKKKDVNKLFKILKPDTIIHLASPKRLSAKDDKASLKMIDNIVNAMNIKSTLVFTSTDKVYANNPMKNTEYSLIKFNNLEFYERDKFLSERLIINKLNKYFIFRLPPTQSNGQIKNKNFSFLDKQIYNLRKKKKIEVYKNIIRSFLKIDEFLAMIYKSVILNKGSLKYGIYNLGSPPISYYDRLIQIADSKKINKKNIIGTIGKIKPIKQKMDTRKINLNGYFFT